VTLWKQDFIFVTPMSHIKFFYIIFLLAKFNIINSYATFVKMLYLFIRIYLFNMYAKKGGHQLGTELDFVLEINNLFLLA